MVTKFMLSARAVHPGMLSLVAVVCAFGITCADPERYEPADGPSVARPQADAAIRDTSPIPEPTTTVDAAVTADGGTSPDAVATADSGDVTVGSGPETAVDGPAAPPDVAKVDAAGTADSSTADSSTASCPSPPLVFDLPCGCGANGKIRCDGTCSAPDTACVPTGEFYVLTNLFLTDARRLDTYGVAPYEVFMATGFGYSGQYWKITPLDKGDYRLTNMFLGPDRSLESSADGKKLFMGTTADVPAQRWRIRAIGNEAAKHFRITNALVGDGRSLDTSTGAPNAPFLNENGNYSGEYWKLTKAP